MERKVTKSTVEIKLTTTILAMKNFETSFKCFLCQSTIMSPKLEMTTTNCSICGGSFLAKLTGISSQCFVMLANRKWYKASTTVSINRFK